MTMILPSLHGSLNGGAQTQKQSFRARLSLLSLSTSALQWLQSTSKMEDAPYSLP